MATIKFTRKNILPYTMLLLFLLFPVTGILFLFINPYHCFSAFIYDWQPTQAQVVSSALERDHNYCDGLKIAVNYKYRVLENEYSSSQYSFINCWPFGETAKSKIVNAYTKNQTITVYYNKAHPDKAVIAKDFLPNLIYGCTPLILIVIIFIFYFKKYPLSFSTKDKSIKL